MPSTRCRSLFPPPFRRLAGSIANCVHSGKARGRDQKAPETWKDTAAAIRAIRERFGGDVRVGAGTVLTGGQLTMCEESGGEYMITPNVNTGLIRECVRRGLVAMPGVMTPSEAVEAWEAGAGFVKIFPAGSFGPGYVKAIRAPLSHIPFLAVGGIGPDNVADFMTAGCVGAGVGIWE